MPCAVGRGGDPRDAVRRWRALSAGITRRVGEAEGDRARCGGAVPDHAGGSGAESGCRASGPDSETPRERARRVAVRRPRDTFDRSRATHPVRDRDSRLLFSIDV